MAARSRGGGGRWGRGEEPEIRVSFSNGRTTRDRGGDDGGSDMHHIPRGRNAHAHGGESGIRDITRAGDEGKCGVVMTKPTVGGKGGNRVPFSFAAAYDGMRRHPQSRRFDASMYGWRCDTAFAMHVCTCITHSLNVIVHVGEFVVGACEITDHAQCALLTHGTEGPGRSCIIDGVNIVWGGVANPSTASDAGCSFFRCAHRPLSSVRINDEHWRPSFFLP